jgi:hypothetical protein
VVHEGLAIAPRPESPLSSGVLIFEATTREALDPSRDFLLTFTGGFAEGLDDSAKSSSFLTLQYPAENVDALPSADLADLR